MKNLNPLLSVFFLASLFFATTVNAQEKKSNVVTEVTVFWLDDIDFNFYNAYNNFLSGNLASSGNELRRAAYFVRQEADFAKDYNQKPILKAASRLESLADSVALGKITRSYKLKRAFSRTHYALANDYQMRAAEFWAADKTKRAGRALTAATKATERAALWGGYTIAKGVKATGKATASATKKTGKAIGKGAKKTGELASKGAKATGKAVGAGASWTYNGVRDVAGKMVQGVGFVPEKVGQGIEWLGKEIKELGKKIESE